jgi:hypothetical protein
MAVAKKAVKKTATKKTVAKRSTVPASAARKARAGGRRIDVHSHVVPAELLQAIERDPARFQMKIEARDGTEWARTMFSAEKVAQRRDGIISRGRGQ